MSTNFGYLQENALYKDFSNVAVEAEGNLALSPAASAIFSRKALELAVKFVYSAERDLKLPYKDNISSLIHDYAFRDLIDIRLFPMLKYVIQLGNLSVHTKKKISREEAITSLKALFEFCGWIDCSYNADYEPRKFLEALLPTGEEQKRSQKELQALSEKLEKGSRDLVSMRAENEKLQAELAALKQNNLQKRAYVVDEITEKETRQRYIDVALMEANWSIGGDCLEEVELQGMPNASGKGFADYVLFGDNRLPLAVVEAKKTSVDTHVGGYQAKLYADCLEKQYGRRPLIFLTNGFDIYYCNDYLDEAPRLVSGFFTKVELELEMNRRTSRIPLTDIKIKDNITNRYYQKAAITAVCESIYKGHRKLLIVQATGSGKTRVSISISDVLLRHNYAKNILFLADRKTLVRQAKNNFTKLLPDTPCCNLLEKGDKNNSPEFSRIIFSTYNTMLNAIDKEKNQAGEKLFTPGHFDLIIMDEAHRSIYNRYQDIFYYFDAMLLGLTATPKCDIDKNTYDVFDLEDGNPTYAYELEQAVNDGFLVTYNTIRENMNLLTEGLHYKSLSAKEQKEFEETFADDENVGEDIEKDAMNKWLFNKPTIDHVLHELMDRGLRVEGGDKLGKTIIFARNTRHAQAIVDRFHALYPELGASFIQQIDYSIKYHENILDNFEDKNKLPQIAVSVDMLDTGVDIPELLNLVFFKTVKSYAKFWQMIGRGTRLCPDLLGEGQDKESFLIFDFGGNFDFFEVNPGGDGGAAIVSLTERIFNTRVAILRELQDADYTAQENYVTFRQEMAADLCQKVQNLNRDSFRVKRHQREVDIYSEQNSWNNIEGLQVTELRDCIAPLLQPDDSDELARRFDYLMLTIMLGTLAKTSTSKPINIVQGQSMALSKKYTIPQVAAKKDFVEKAKSEEFWQTADVMEQEKVREALRELMQYLDKTQQKIYFTNFADEVVDIKETGAIYASGNLQNYKERVTAYLKEHENNIAVFKLRHNRKVTVQDLEELERILWGELGSKEDYKKFFADKPVGKMVRQLAGLDREAANDAFSRIISEGQLSSRQINFINLIIDYVVENGNIEDVIAVFNEAPFVEHGSIIDIFKDKMAAAKSIVEKLKEISSNSVA